jgi:hypothetical protein
MSCTLRNPARAGHRAISQVGCLRESRSDHLDQESVWLAVVAVSPHVQGYAAGRSQPRGGLLGRRLETGGGGRLAVW